MFQRVANSGAGRRVECTLLLTTTNK